MGTEVYRVPKESGGKGGSLTEFLVRGHPQWSLTHLERDPLLPLLYLRVPLESPSSRERRKNTLSVVWKTLVWKEVGYKLLVGHTWTVTSLGPVFYYRFTVRATGVPRR